MSRIVAILFVGFVAAVACGFNWGGDPCQQANKLLQDARLQKDEVKQKKYEDKIIQLCPDGAAAKFVLGVRMEQAGRGAEAITDYRASVAKGDAPAEAHGNLGLLLLSRGLDDEASVELTRGLLGRPDPAYHKGLAVILAASKVYPLALFHYQEAAKGYPLDPQIQGGLAECFDKVGKPEKAEAHYRKALQLDPGSIPTQLSLARFYTNRNRLAEAIALLKKASGEYPKEKEIHRLLAEAYREKGDTAQAREQYRLAGMDVSIDPQDFLRKGDEYLAAKSYEKAATAYRVALKGKPGWTEALQKLGEAELEAGHNDAALDAYRQALAADPKDADALYNVAVLYERKGLFDDSIKAYQQALQQDPGNGDVLRRLADIYSLRGNFAEAIAQYQELLRQRGENPLLHLKLSKLYEKSRDYKRAVAEYQRALQLDPENLEAHKELATLYWKRRGYDAAIAQYKEVLRLSKTDADARRGLTALYVKKKRYAELLTLLNEGIELQPNDANGHYKLGLVYEFNKDYPAAIAEYGRTTALQPDNAKGLNALGRLYLKMGRLDEAKQTLEASKKADPTFAEPQLLLANMKADLATQEETQHEEVVSPKRVRHHGKVSSASRDSRRREKVHGSKPSHHNRSHHKGKGRKHKKKAE
jgi:tetratricopeptide (TPR) repeat protein